MTVQRFNTNHAPAGSANGGQFTSGSGGGSGGSGEGGGGKAAPKPMTAHQKHVAHEQHLAAHPGSPGARAQRKAALLEQAKADRAKAAVLEKQLHGLKQQEAKAAQTAKHAHAAAANAKAGPHQKRTLAHKAAVTHHRHQTLKQKISGLQDQIDKLLGQAKADEAQAAKL